MGSPQSAVVMASSSMPAVHEKMHERTSQEGQPKQSPEYMSLMLGEQQRSSDCRDYGEHESDEEVARQGHRSDAT